MNTSHATSALPPTVPRSDTGEALIRVDGVAKRFSSSDGTQVNAIGMASLEIKRGEFVSILGASGCGKSTLMLIMAGLLPPSQGRVTFEGREVLAPLSDFGVVFQDPILLPWRSVRENVELPAEIAGIEKRERAHVANDMLKLVGLSGFENKRPNELSGGMQQRVAIARALSRKPALLFMDEPFAALDAMTREQMNLELQRISLESKTTVVFVTHSVSEAAFLSNRVLVMSGRPSSVVADVTIPIERPRPIRLTSSDMLGRYIIEIREKLDAAY